MEQEHSGLVPAAGEPVDRCPCCGAISDESDEPVIKRGAIVVAFDPITVWWKEYPVPLSPTEAHVFARLAQRGRIHTTEIDQLLAGIGAKASTRSLILGHIRAKFQALGACDPIERIGMYIIRLRVDPDERGSTLPVIGARQTRYARADR